MGCDTLYICYSDLVIFIRMCARHRMYVWNSRAYIQDEISRRGGGPNSSSYDEISSLTYISIIFFCLEYLSLFAGVSLFFPGANAMRTCTCHTHIHILRQTSVNNRCLRHFESARLTVKACERRHECPHLRILVCA